MSLRRHTKGFTLIEIAGIIIIISILVALACASYFKVISKSEDTEALTNLAAIRKAELSKYDESGTFVNATDTSDINDKLPSPEIQDKTFRYKVVNATAENFTAIAERIKGGAADKPIEIAMYAGGDLSHTYAPQGGPVSGAGGGYTSGSGGYSGGGGGSGSGFSLSGGSSSGGASGGSAGGGTSGGGGGSGGVWTTLVPAPEEPPTSEITSIPSYIFEVLKGTTNGDYAYDLIISESIDLYFASLGSSFIGLYLPSWWSHFYPDYGLPDDSIFLGNDLESRGWTKEAMAGIIVHEAMHADWSHNTDKWVQHTVDELGVDESQLSWYTDPVTGEQILGDSVFQEFHAFEMELLFWKEVRGSQTNWALDHDLNLYERGPEYLYAEIQSRYAGYPPY